MYSRFKHPYNKQFNMCLPCVRKKEEAYLREHCSQYNPYR